MTTAPPPTSEPDPTGPTEPDVLPKEETAPGRRGWIIAFVVLLVAALAVIAFLLLDDQGEPVTPPVSPVPSASTPEPTTPEPTEPSQEPVAGCAPNDATIPTGADIAVVVDVDRDGRPDQAWLTGGATRELGVTTASGATFSTPVESAAPEPASAVVQLVQTDEIPIALVDLGREALLYSLAGCAITPVANAQGEPYTFDRGFAGEGTGVGCTEDGGALRLAGLDAVAGADGTYTVTRTFVDLDADGRRATNGEPEQVATAAAADDPVVTTAQEVSCGDLVAGEDGPVEPQG